MFHEFLISSDLFQEPLGQFQITGKYEKRLKNLERLHHAKVAQYTRDLM